MNTLNDQQTPSVLLSLILSYAYTRNDAIHSIELIQSLYQQSLFSAGNNESLAGAIQSLKNTQSISEKEMQLINKLSELNVTVSPSQLSSLISCLTDSINTYPLLTLYVPMELESEDITRIGVWARNQVHKQVLLSFLIAPEYIGGCGISWNGVLKDYGYSNLYEQQKKIILAEITNR
jgi:F0F1-type ATP synthase delta subunit